MDIWYHLEWMTDWSKMREVKDRLTTTDYLKYSKVEQKMVILKKILLDWLVSYL